MTIISIFWPTDVRLQASQSFFYGWRTDVTVAVAGLLHTDNGNKPLAQDRFEKAALSSSPAVQELLRLSGRPPKLLGLCQALIPGSKVPSVQFFDTDIHANPLRFILYRRPQISGHHFFTLQPLHLDITDAKQSRDEDDAPNLKRLLSDRMALLAEFDFTQEPNNAKSLQPVIQQLNAAYELDRLLKSGSAGSDSGIFDVVISKLRGAF
ncbi:hypothetical protein FRB90_008924, partial [Tulasnella sp. 427]